METQSAAADPSLAEAKRRSRWRWVMLGLAIWAALAYFVAPDAWKYYFGRAKPLPDVARVTHTSDGHPGDPVTLSSSVRIAVDTVLRRPDDTAPVSPLFLFGRKEDLAFEQPVPGGPRHRHHVRFWRWNQARNGVPVWFGSATYDERAGLSYTTGQITHHIGPDVDAERDRIAAELMRAHWAGGIEWIDDFHQQHEGRNGGGDLWRTDGRLAVVRLVAPR